MKKLIIGYLLISFSFATAYSQKSGMSEISLHFGLSPTKFSNRYFSYLNAEGVAAALGFGYVRSTKASIFEFGVKLNNGVFASDYQHFTPSYLEFNAYLSYSRQLQKRQDKHTFYIGGGLQSELWFFQDNFEDITDLVSIIPSHSLLAIGTWNYQLSQKSGIELNSRLTVLSLVATQPYSSFDETWVDKIEDLSILYSGKVMPIWKFMMMQNQIKYYRNLGSRFKIGGALQFKAGVLRSHRKVSVISNTIHIQLSYKL